MLGGAFEQEGAGYIYIYIYIYVVALTTALLRQVI